MKNTQSSTIKKVRSKTNFDVYYTSSTWDSKEIEGVNFLPVTKDNPESNRDQRILYMRKDTLEFIK